MSQFVTYVVEHGSYFPPISAGEVIRGGVCIGVAFEDLLMRDALHEEEVTYLRAECERLRRENQAHRTYERERWGSAVRAFGITPPSVGTED